MKNANVSEIENLSVKKNSFPQGDQVAFYFSKAKEMAYFPRFWVVNNQKEYQDLMNHICNIDLVVHPEIKSFPQTYELINNKNSPDLKPINN